MYGYGVREVNKRGCIGSAGQEGVLVVLVKRVC